MGVRLGNWLTAEQARKLWQVPDPATLKGKRDRALLAILLGCGLRRREAAELDVARLQRREDHLAIVDLIGKGRHIRTTVPVPEWVKAAIDSWLACAGISDGRLFRCVCRAGKTWGDGVTERVVWHAVKDCAKQAGIQKLAPHDLRRTCARLCHLAGGELEQIQFLLGHVSVQTTGNISRLPTTPTRCSQRSNCHRTAALSVRRPGGLTTWPYHAVSADLTRVEVLAPSHVRYRTSELAA